MNRLRQERLVQRIKQGDEQAFAEMYEATRKGVFSYIYSILHNFAVSEEIMQDTYITVKLKIGTYKDNSNFSAWMLQIAKNLSYNYLRKSKRETVSDDAVLHAGKSYSMAEEGKPVISAMKKALNEEELQIVLLHVVAGYKHREIAAMLDKPLGTVTWTYNNAIKKSREYFEKEEDN